MNRNTHGKNSSGRPSRAGWFRRRCQRPGLARQGGTLAGQGGGRALQGRSLAYLLLGVVCWLLATVSVARGAQPTEDGPRPAEAESSAAEVEPSAAARRADEPRAQPVPLGGDAELPWNTAPRSRSRLPVQELGGPRELLELYGVDSSHIRQLFDGRPVGVDEQETLVRILYRLPRFGLDSIDRWTSPRMPGDELAADPDAHRIGFHQLTGTVRRVERREILPELAKLFDFASYYEVQLRLDDDPHPVIVFTREVPSQWPLGEPLDEGARAAGLFLKVGREREGPDELIFAAHRIAWLPREPRPAWGITRHHVLLAELGMDVSLLNDVRDRNRKPIGAEDRECFYQMLAAAGRLTPEMLADFPADTFDLAPLLLEPRTQHGRLIRCRGVARRITRIVVDDPDIRQRFGIDHYYQLDVSLPLGERIVRLGQEGEEGPVFTNSFPATFCVLELPPKLQQLTEALASGALESETLNETVRIDGFYFKLWAFKSQYVSSFDQRQRQIAPMLVAAVPEVVEFQLSRNPWMGVLGGGAFLLLLLLAWWGVWRFNRSDTRFERTVIRRQFRPEPGTSLNESGIEAQDGPDFSHLRDED